MALQIVGQGPQGPGGRGDLPQGALQVGHGGGIERVSLWMEERAAEPSFRVASRLARVFSAAEDSPAVRVIQALGQFG